MRYWLLKYLLAVPILRSLFRIEVIGAENLPTEGPMVLASNHLSMVDSLFLPVVVRRKVTFLAKSQYFTGTGVMGAVRRGFMNATGQVPIDRSGGTASVASLNAGVGVLSRGEILGIYPEGTRSPDGRLYRGRTGVARMILTANAPVVPISLAGTEKVLPLGANWPRVGQRVTVTFGKPLNFERFIGLSSDRFVLRSVTDEIMYEIMRLGSQEYVDVYASTIKGNSDFNPRR